MAETWATEAKQRVMTRFEGVRWWPWQRGLWVTARVDYRARALPGEVVEIDVAGTVRRVALSRGAGRPLLILPGLYASLTEGLFADLFVGLAATGRTVALVEDRMGAPTLQRLGGEVVGLARQGAELAGIVAWLGEIPDVLALSAGVAVGLAAPPGSWRRLAGWSGVVDARAVARVQHHPLLGPYYTQVHRRAFSQAGLPPPPVAEVFAQLIADPVPPPAGRETVLIHAADDPVVPVCATAGAEILVLPGGGHLGFGAVVGNDVYALPFEEGG